MAEPSTMPVPCEGGEMALHVWRPQRGSGPGVLLIHEVFGVGPYIRAVAERLAAAGYVVGAPDVFWRFAPGWESGHDREGLEASVAAAQQLDQAMATLDCVAALDTLRSLTGAPTGVIGFCMGGTLAWATAAAADPAVCVSYYGSGVAAMIDRIDDLTCPTLLQFGNDDPYIPAADIDAVNEAIDGRPNVVINVENAGHAFDNHEAEMFWNESAALAAWAKTMAFLAEHLPA